MLEAFKKKKKKASYWLEGEVKNLVGLVFLFVFGGAVHFFCCYFFGGVCMEGSIPSVMNGSVLVLIVATTGLK